MKRLLLLTLAAAVAISLVAVMGVRSLGSSGGSASAAGPTVALDLVEDSGWCNVINDTASVQVGNVHKAAICLVQTAGSTAASDFDIVVNFNTAVNDCTNTGQSGVAVDANPDFVGQGTGFNCSLGGLKYPYCKINSNEDPPVTTSEAFITCGTTTDPGNVASGVEPIAVITWTASAVGADNLTFGVANFFDYSGAGILTCPSANCLGATVDKTAPPPTPTNTPVPAECDIGVSVPMAANPPALAMKVGDAPQVIDLTSTWKNFGAVTQGAPAATCNFAIAEGAEILISNPPLVTVAVDPTKLAVRMVPNGNPAAPYGDVCLRCTATQGTKSIGDCLDPTKGAKGRFDPLPTPVPADWTYEVMPCQEYGYNSALPMDTYPVADGGCRDGADNDIPADGTIDWAGYSTNPDPECLNVQAIGLIPVLRTVLAPQAESLKTRAVEVQCLARGVYPLFVFGGNSQAAAYPPGSPAATDPNGANNSSGALVMVTCTAGPEMVKDCDPLTEGIQTACNLWLIDPTFAGKTQPEVLPPADDNGCVIAEEGKGCLAVDIWLKSAGDDDDTNDSDLIPECLGAWEHQIRFDHKIIGFDRVLDPEGWLESTGRVATCSVSILAENWILEGCVTTDGPAPGMQVGPCGDGIVERLYVIPQYNDLIYRGIFRPTKDNGVVTNIVDDNCEITDIYAEPMADTLPGGLTPICGDLTITVRMLEGDIDLDCDVDVADASVVAMRYGSSWGLQLYDQWFDLEPKYADQDIDIKDVQFIFGRDYSTCQAPIPDDQSTPVDPGQP